MKTLVVGAEHTLKQIIKPRDAALLFNQSMLQALAPARGEKATCDLRLAT